MYFETDTLILAFGLTLLAGLSTGIGSFLAFFTKRTNTKFLSASLGFSAGVMIYVSFMEMLPVAQLHMYDFFSDANLAAWFTVFSFFGGILVIAIIDRLIPKFENPHEPHSVEELSHIDKSKFNKLYGSAMLTAFAITLHNLPEGLATFAAALYDPALGIAIGIAVALHNIPEGIAVSVPLYYATNDRKKAFTLSFLSGLAEPLGALIGFIFLLPFLTQSTFDVVFGFFFAFVAGIMVFISLDELLPSAHEFGHHHHSIYGLIAGMAVMALSLILLN